MKITFWIQGSSLPIEYRVPNDEEISDWVDFLDAIRTGRFAEDFLWLDDGAVEHYVRVSMIDVIKVEA